MVLEKDLLYAARAAMPFAKIKKNHASLNSAGFFGYSFYTEAERAILQSGKFKTLPIYDRVIGRKEKHLVKLELETDFYRAHHAKKASRSEEDSRLVQGRKSPTGRHQH